MGCATIVLEHVHYSSILRLHITCLLADDAYESLAEDEEGGEEGEEAEAHFDLSEDPDVGPVEVIEDDDEEGGK